MKKAILFLLVIVTVTAKAQSLKDLLYSGKLKNDSNTVIRKTDDLSTKIDTARKKQAEPEKPKIVATIPVDSPGSKVAPPVEQASTVAGTTAVAGTTSVAGTTAAVGTTEAVTTEAPVKNTAAPVKNNNKIWKEYTDSLSGSLKTEVLSSKKVKKETYYLMVEYEIDTVGAVSVTNVTASPENTFLQEQVKQRILLSPPQLSPVVDSSNKARKVKRKYSFNITKE